MTRKEVPFIQRTFRLEKLKPWKNNPRTITDEELNKLKDSIQRKPYFINARPIVVSDRTGELVVIAGNQRLKALKELGWSEAPCIVFHCETEEEEADIALTDNHNNGEWDVEALTKNFSKFPLKDWLGSDWEKMAEEFDEVTEKKLREVEPEVIPAEPKTKLGEVYALGKHRLIIGDSTKPETLQTLMGGVEADMILTDPPYNVNIQNSQGMRIENDNMSEASFREFLGSSFSAMATVLKAGGVFYVWHASRTQREFEDALNGAGLEVRQQIVWLKNSFVLGRQDYQWIHEPCFTGWKEGAPHYFVDDRSLSTVFEQENTPLEDMTKDELKERLEEIYNLPATVIREDKPRKNESHPDMKPVNLFGKLIRNSSRRGEIVLDPFAGSGTTVVACEQLGRIAYVVEYDPRYADVIIDRWEKLTGEKARKT